MGHPIPILQSLELNIILKEVLHLYITYYTNLELNLFPLKQNQKMDLEDFSGYKKQPHKLSFVMIRC